MQKSIAILMACHNRIEFTERCIESLTSFNIKFDIFLLDDDSEDGTSYYINKRFPNVNLIYGDGKQFWTRGMNKAWKEACKNNYDNYIWLNDDVVLLPNAFYEIFEISKIYNNKAIVSGIIKSETGKILYGGFDSEKKIIIPNGTPQDIRYLNGNFVLIPKFVFERLGFFDSKYHHDLGDVDYGLNAQSKQIDVKSTRVAIGIGSENNICRIRKNNTTIVGRFKHLNKPLGSPLSILFYFKKKHFGPFRAILSIVFVVFLNMISDRINKDLFGERYI